MPRRQNNDEMMNGMNEMNPTITGSGDNWELLSAAWLSTDETDNGDGTITSTAYYGEDYDNDNYSKLISECYTGVVSVSTTYTSDAMGEIIGDIIFSLSDGGDFNYFSTGSITSFDLNTFLNTKSAFSGRRVTYDVDEL